MPGSMAFAGLRRASHIALPSSVRTRPFTCAAHVRMPNQRAAARSTRNHGAAPNAGAHG